MEGNPICISSCSPLLTLQKGLRGVSAETFWRNLGQSFPFQGHPSHAQLKYLLSQKGPIFHVATKMWPYLVILRDQGVTSVRASEVDDMSTPNSLTQILRWAFSHMSTFLCMCWLGGPSGARGEGQLTQFSGLWVLGKVPRWSPK